MPVYAIQADSRIARLPVALRARMDKQGHTQSQVSSLTGVSQPEISKALKGMRKRPTPSMLALCFYANLDEVSSATEIGALAHELVDTVRQNPGVAEHVEVILQRLIVLVRREHSAGAQRQHG